MNQVWGRGFLGRVSLQAFLILSFWFGLALAAQDHFAGRLDVVWGDGEPGRPSLTHQKFFLNVESGGVIEVVIDEALSAPLGGAADLIGRWIEVSGQTEAAADGSGIRLIADGLWRRLDEGPRRGGVMGSKPWISLLLKFSDIGAEPRDLNFFTQMFGNQPGQLDHYWREVSYNNINIVGSTAVNWTNLPNPQTSYIPSPGSGANANLGALFNDSVNAVDGFVDFSNGGTGGYEGINLMFNGVLDCCAWGGTRFATLDGVSKVWRVTWEPPWAYAEEGVIAHEMGHGFGLPHSNNSDGDSDPYDSPWDVMSAATGYSVSDPTYGRLGKHTCAYHKDRLGWFSPSEIRHVDTLALQTVIVDQIALAVTTNYRMIRIPINGSASHYYVVEVRDMVGNYDGNLPGNAVLIFEVQAGRSEPAWVVDGDPIPANYADTEGVMWRVGETFIDSANQIRINVTAATANGFEITVDTRDCSSSNPFFIALPNWPENENILTLMQLLICN